MLFLLDNVKLLDTPMSDNGIILTKEHMDVSLGSPSSGLVISLS